jgi:hypothetical protein
MRPLPLDHQGHLLLSLRHLGHQHEQQQPAEAQRLQVEAEALQVQFGPEGKTAELTQRTEKHAPRESRDVRTPAFAEAGFSDNLMPEQEDIAVLPIQIKTRRSSH